MIIERFRFFDKDTRPEQPIPASSPIKAKKLARRRRYSHTFSAGRTFKLVRAASGQNRWRRVPNHAIVHYGKVQLKFKGDKSTRQ